MVEMAAKQTIVEEIVRNAYFKFRDGISNNRATRRGQLIRRLDSGGKKDLGEKGTAKRE